MITYFWKNFFFQKGNHLFNIYPLVVCWNYDNNLHLDILYASIIFCSPSSNETFGSQSNSCFAFTTSALRLSGSSSGSSSLKTISLELLISFFTSVAYSKTVCSFG